LTPEFPAVRLKKDYFTQSIHQLGPPPRHHGVIGSLEAAANRLAQPTTPGVDRATLMEKFVDQVPRLLKAPHLTVKL